MFDLTGKKKKGKMKKPDVRQKTTKMAKDIRKRFLSNLKEQHKAIKKEIKAEQKQDNTKTTSTEELKGFAETTSFLNNLAERRRKKKQRQKTKKQHSKTVSNPDKPTLQIKTEYLGEHDSAKGGQIRIKPDPPYGVLKRGKKKTYREYFNKPLRAKIAPPAASVGGEIVEPSMSPTPPLPPTPMKPRPPVSIETLPLASETVKTEPLPVESDVVDDAPLISAPVLSRIEKLQQYKAGLPPKKRRTFTIKRKHFSLGLKGNEVSFIKKNKTVRRGYDKMLSDISVIPISSKKQFLYSKGLLKRGSEAPDVMVCQMYKDAILCGEIETIKKNDLNITIE